MNSFDHIGQTDITKKIVSAIQNYRFGPFQIAKLDIPTHFRKDEDKYVSLYAKSGGNEVALVQNILSHRGAEIPNEQIDTAIAYAKYTIGYIESLGEEGKKNVLSAYNQNRIDDLKGRSAENLAQALIMAEQNRGTEQVVALGLKSILFNPIVVGLYNKVSKNPNHFYNMLRGKHTIVANRFVKFYLNRNRILSGDSAILKKVKSQNISTIKQQYKKYLDNRFEGVKAKAIGGLGMESSIAA